jgi:tripartite-type tricarboxylate transporter receptor subunit TctC
MDSRRWILATAAFLGVLLCLPAAVPAQSWPAKPIRVIVPFPPAGGTDVLTRQLAEKISAATKWTLVIDNKPGAGGNIGLDALAKSAADGYTIGMGQTANLAINPNLYSKMPFDALKDFAPAGTPADIIAQLNAEIARALTRPDFLEKLTAEGSQPLGGSPQRFAEFLRAEHAKWGVAVRASGAKVD